MTQRLVLDRDMNEMIEENSRKAWEAEQKFREMQRAEECEVENGEKAKKGTTTN